MPDIRSFAFLEDVVETLNIAVDIGLWVGEGITYPGLCCQIYDDVRAGLGKKCGNVILVFKVAFAEMVIFVPAQNFQSGLLQLDGIIIILSKSKLKTSSPCSKSVRVRWKPINPADPVTTILCLVRSSMVTGSNRCSWMAADRKRLRVRRQRHLWA